MEDDRSSGNAAPETGLSETNDGAQAVEGASPTLDDRRVRTSGRRVVKRARRTHGMLTPEQGGAETMPDTW